MAESNQPEFTWSAIFDLFFHLKPSKALIANLNHFLLRDCKAHGGEGWLDHQAGVNPETRFPVLLRQLFNGFIKPTKNSGSLCGWPDVSEVDVTSFGKTHESDHVAGIRSNENGLRA